jgi:hypothetical protein
MADIQLLALRPAALFDAHAFMAPCALDDDFHQGGPPAINCSGDGVLHLNGSHKIEILEILYSDGRLHLIPDSWGEVFDIRCWDNPNRNRNRGRCRNRKEMGPGHEKLDVCRLVINGMFGSL